MTTTKTKPKQPQELSIADIRAQLGKLTPDWLASNGAFYAGDHWQEGRGWSGPQLTPDNPGYRRMMDEIQRGFVSKNAVAEVVGRAVGGVLGHEPVWALTVRRPLADGEAPTAEEQALIAEAEAALTTWWDNRGAHEQLQEAAATMLWASRAALRLFVPPGLLDEEGRVPAGDLAVSLERIFLEHPAPTQAAVIRDRSTMREIGLYYAEEQDLDGKPVQAAEISYADGAATVLRALRAGEFEEVRQNLGGQPLIYEMRRPVLISESVRQLQRLLNLALSMLSRNVVLGGFLERVILGGMPPGTWSKDASGKEMFTPAPMQVGAGSVNYVSGQPIRDEKGKITGYTSPSVAYRDPVSVQTFRDTRQEAYQGILEECHQLHAAISGDATASGEARRQAMADFLIDLLRSAPQINRAGRWLLETVLAQASIFAGQPGRYAGLRAEFSCRIDLGPISVEELRLLIELVKARLMSRETAMSRAGIEDVAAELARILADAIAAQERAQQMLQQQAKQPAEEQQNTQDPAQSQSQGQDPEPTEDQQ